MVVEVNIINITVVAAKREKTKAGYQFQKTDLWCRF